MIRLTDAESFRLSVIVAAGIPRADAIRVIEQQRAARDASRPAPRVVSTSRVRSRVTASDRNGPDGMPIVAPVRRDGTHRPYRVQGVFA